MDLAAPSSVTAPPTVSIVVLTRHRPQRLERCLAALARLPDDVSHEILVLLNGADQDMRAVLDAPGARVRVFESPVNLGFAAGCNQMVAAAAGRYLVFLNDDTEVEAGWLQPLVDIAEADPSVGAVGSVVLFPDGSIQETGAVIWRDGSTLALGRGELPNAPSVAFVRQVDYCSACSLLVRREAWRAAKGFCEEYFPAYYEDVDFCLSIRAQGYRVVYAPGSRVRHHGGGSSESTFRAFLQLYQRERFRQRWQHVLEEFEPPNPESVAAIRRAAFRARGCPRRLLVIDDRLPTPTGGSSGRMSDAVSELSDAGYAVGIWPSQGLDETFWELGKRGIEVIAGALEAHLRDPCVLYDIVVISKRHHFERYAALVRECQPQSVLVYDAASGSHVVDARSTLADNQGSRTHALETSLRVRADFVTCASQAEEALFRATNGAAPIVFVPSRTQPMDRASARAWVQALTRAQSARSMTDRSAIRTGDARAVLLASLRNPLR